MPTADRLHLRENHKLDAVLAVIAFGLAAVGLTLIAFDEPRAGGWLGVAGVAVGLWGQMVSRTRPERFLDVIGVVAAAVAVMVGFARGGMTFSG